MSLQLKKRASIWRKLYIILIHISLWALYATIQVLATSTAFKQWASVCLNMVFLHAFSAVIFYTNAEWLLPRTLEKKNKAGWLLGLFAMYVYLIVMRYLFIVYIFPLYNDIKINIEPVNFVLNVIWWWFMPIAFSTGWWFARYALKRERTISMQRQAINRKENEQMQLEVAYLRAQINPHFLFNTLGYFYNKTANNQPDVADGIAALTNIMRSSMKKRGPNDMVLLEEEMEHIESLISIYQMRFNHNIHVEYNRPDLLADYKILPHILITLVENAFKHGELHNVHHPLKIKLLLEENGLHFYIHNRKRIGPKEMSNGIGMKYVYQQLQNAYKDHYSFVIEDMEHFYSLSLHISHHAITA